MSVLAYASVTPFTRDTILLAPAFTRHGAQAVRGTVSRHQTWPQKGNLGPEGARKIYWM